MDDLQARADALLPDLDYTYEHGIFDAVDNGRVIDFGEITTLIRDLLTALAADSAQDD